MAPRKKANKQQPQPAPPATTPASLPTAEYSTPQHSGPDLAGYPEVQRNEFLATEAIYADGFLRLHGRKDAWKVCDHSFPGLSL
jgi:hypothetical protein